MNATMPTFCAVRNDRGNRQVIYANEDALKEVSGRYSLVTPAFVAEHAQSRGFNRVSEQWTRSRGRVFQRFSFGDARLKELTPMIEVSQGVIANGALCVTAGLYRLVCSNGLVVRESGKFDARVRHVGAASSAFQWAFDCADTEIRRIGGQLGERLEKTKAVPVDMRHVFGLGKKTVIKVVEIADRYKIERQAGELSLWDIIQAITEFSQSRPPARRSELDALAGRLLLSNT